jgi:hypothetical protein
MRVVTWQAPNGQRVDVCDACSERMTLAGTWPCNGRGEQYCTVHHGGHDGHCGEREAPHEFRNVR